MEGAPEDPGRDYWFDARALTDDPLDDPEAPPSARKSFRQAWRGSRSLRERVDALREADLKAIVAERLARKRPMEVFAEANGAIFCDQTYDKLPGMIFRQGERRNVLTWEGPPYVEFGNFHTVGQELARMFGYVAIRHDRGLPRLVVDTLANDATPPAGSRLYAKKGSHTSLTENYRGSDSASMMSGVAADVQLLDLGEGWARCFAVYAERGREAEARRWLSAETLGLLYELGASFDIEVTSEWFFLYGYGFEVSHWSRVERWAWVFSTASQVLDRMDWWGEAGRSDSSQLPGFYTEERLPRSADLPKLPKPSPGWGAFWGSDSLWG